MGLCLELGDAATPGGGDVLVMDLEFQGQVLDVGKMNGKHIKSFCAQLTCHFI